MDTIVTAIIATGTMGLLAAALLVIASKLMHIKVDPKAELLRDALPGANCGACGFSGCDGYADALAKGEAAPDLCPPGGEEVYKKINEILGRADDGGGPVKKTAIARCGGGKPFKSNKMEYDGIRTCFAAEQLFGGENACTFGCLGYGDCAVLCPRKAICVTDGIARIDARKCNGCGLCVSACPRGVLAVIEEPIHALVLCRNTEKGALVRKKCTKGCIACTKCARECPAKAIEITDFLAVIDNLLCTGCGRCADACVTKCILINCNYSEAPPSLRA